MNSTDFAISATVEVDGHEWPARAQVRADDAEDAVRRGADQIKLDIWNAGYRGARLVYIEAIRENAR